MCDLVQCDVLVQSDEDECVLSAKVVNMDMCEEEEYCNDSGQMTKMLLQQKNKKESW